MVKQALLLIVLVEEKKVNFLFSDILGRGETDRETETSDHLGDDLVHLLIGTEQNQDDHVRLIGIGQNQEDHGLLRTEIEMNLALKHHPIGHHGDAQKTMTGNGEVALCTKKSMSQVQCTSDYDICMR